MGKIKKRLDDWTDQLERKIDKNWGYDISTPAARRKAFWHFQLIDHAFLRTFWTNMDEIAPGVWRSNHPSPKRLQKVYDLGIRSILSLRGPVLNSPQLFEYEACEKLGIAIRHCPLGARSLMPREKVLAVLDTFEKMPKPFLMHCKSGADRAGLASALWLLHMENRPISEAKKQLSKRYIHFESFRTGILDHMLKAYEADCASKLISIREWIETRYDPEKLTREFREMRGLN